MTSRVADCPDRRRARARWSSSWRRWRRSPGRSAPSGSTCSARPWARRWPAPGRPPTRRPSTRWCSTAAGCAGRRSPAGRAGTRARAGHAALGTGDRRAGRHLRAGCDAVAREAFTRYQREAAAPETGRDMLALCYQVDVSADLRPDHAPTLVIHRERDRAAPREQGEALAAGIPGRPSRCCPAGRTSPTSATWTRSPAAYGGFSVCRHAAPVRSDPDAAAAGGGGARCGRSDEPRHRRAARHHRAFGRVARGAHPRPDGLSLARPDRRMVRRERLAGLRYFPR